MQNLFSRIPRCSPIPVRGRYPQKNRPPPRRPPSPTFHPQREPRQIWLHNTAAGSLAFIFRAHQRGVLTEKENKESNSGGFLHVLQGGFSTRRSGGGFQPLPLEQSGCCEQKKNKKSPISAVRNSRAHSGASVFKAFGPPRGRG